MSSTFKLQNKTSTPFRLNTKPDATGVKPWPFESYYIKNIVIGPAKTESVVVVDRLEKLKDGHTYIITSKITTRENNLLCSVSLKVERKILSSDIYVKLDNSDGSKSTGWVSGKGKLPTSIGDQKYELTFYWVSQSFSIYENLEVSILQLNHLDRN